MWRPLHSTKRCELFNELSEVIWDEISDYHQLGCDSDESGITKYILREFKRFSSNVIRNFQLYAKPGYKESIYGGDLDVYLGIGWGQYRWFAMQAKLLKHNGIYDTMKDGYSASNQSYQWDKLAHLEGVSGCTSLYLFYNGSNHGFKYSGNDRCHQSFDEKQFGCSVVETSMIKSDMEKRMKKNPYHNPRFTDYHPSIALPWRELICCPHRNRNQDFTPYYREDIEGAVEEYERIEIYQADDVQFKRLEEVERRFIQEELEFSKIERPSNLIPIIDRSREAKWSPQFKIVINTTQDSGKYGK